MSNPGTLSAALAFVPSWWQETADPTALDTLLAGWSRACGWRVCGFVWANEAGQTLVKTVQGTALVEAGAPLEVPDALRRIRSGESSVTYSVPNSTGRVFAGVQLSGRPLGLVWAERVAGQPWTDADRAYLVLTAKTMERAPAVVAVMGSTLDSDKLFQRLGDTATIAGRMAHDFDNILTGIIGFSDLALPLLQPGSQAANWVADIGKVGQRGIVFTQQLHQLSRSGQVKPNPASLAAAIAKEETRLRPVAGSTVRVEKDLPAGLPLVALEAGSLQTVLGHLIENGIEACTQGGSVRVTARPVELSEPDARAFLGKATGGSYLLVTITDTGIGMKPEVRRRLFVEPFCTTKVRHRGLGLAIVYRTLCAHRGGIQIEVVPLPGTGTQVRVVLPLATAHPPAIAGITPAGHTATVGNKSATTVGG